MLEGISLPISSSLRLQAIQARYGRPRCILRGLKCWSGAVLLVADVLASGEGTTGVVGFLHRVAGHSARSTVALKSSLWRLIASISPSNSPMRTMPLKNGASLSQ